MTAVESGAGTAAPRARVLDPLERSSEIIYGVIMALSFTGSLSVAAAGRQDVRTMLVAALGCNAAWGIVDGVMYVLTDLIQRSRARLEWLAVRNSPDPEAGRRTLAAELLGEVAGYLQPEELERIRLDILSAPGEPPPPHAAARDLIGAVGIFLLVFIATLPVALPFAIIHDPVLALRTSHAVAMATLFVAGYRLGRFGGFVPWRSGLVMLGLGAVLVLITLALGG